MTKNGLRPAGTSSEVEVTTGDDDTVTVELGGQADGITIVGPRYDVHSMIIEADRQLSRLSERWD